jgi:hypothetical protein
MSCIVAQYLHVDMIVLIRFKQKKAYLTFINILVLCPSCVCENVGVNQKWH